MGLDLFTLTKLTIEGYKDERRSGKPLGTFTAQYNPETFSIHHENAFEGQQGIGCTSGARAWSHSPPKRLTVDLVLDGTKVGYMGAELLRRIPTVAEQIGAFVATCYQLVGEIRQPLFLKLK